MSDRPMTNFELLGPPQTSILRNRWVIIVQALVNPKLLARWSQLKRDEKERV